MQLIIQPVMPNVNMNEMTNTFNSTYNSSSSQKMRGSLNQVTRKQEILRINRQNQKMLQQLQDVKPGVGTMTAWKKHATKFENVRNLRKIGDTGQQFLYKINTDSVERKWNNSVNLPMMGGGSKMLSSQDGFGSVVP
jgi:hypothetical protein